MKRTPRLIRLSSSIPHSSFRRFAFPHIKLVHCHRYASMDQTFQRIDGAIETGIQYIDLFSRERLQHIVRRILTRCRPADSDLNPHKLRRPDRVNDRLDPIMSPMSTGLLDPETPQIEIKIVMDENQVVGVSENSRRRPLSGGP